MGLDNSVSEPKCSGTDWGHVSVRTLPVEGTSPDRVTNVKNPENTRGREFRHRRSLGVRQDTSGTDVSVTPPRPLRGREIRNGLSEDLVDKLCSQPRTRAKVHGKGHDTRTPYSTMCCNKSGETIGPTDRERQTGVHLGSWSTERLTNAGRGPSTATSIESGMSAN